MASPQSSCQCYGSTHTVRTNCTNCGRVHCIQEDVANCLNCSNILVYDVFIRDLNESNDRDLINSYIAASELVDKLLAFQLEEAKQTTVLDHTTDWYDDEPNPWTVKEDPVVDYDKDSSDAAIRKRIDLVQQKMKTAHVVNDVSKDREMIYDDISKILMAHESMAPAHHVGQSAADHVKDQREGMLVEEAAYAGSHHQYGKGKRFASCISQQLAIEICDDNSFASQPEGDNWKPLPRSLKPKGRDEGHVISIFQPWASLIVIGYKRLTGRVLNTEHRGYLWIHSCPLPTNAEDYEKLSVILPSLYPNGPGIPPIEAMGTGCLLGRVVLEDVIENKCAATRKLLEDEGENEAPYVYIFKEPEQLRMPIRYQGKRGISKMNMHDMDMYSRALFPSVWCTE